MRGDEFACPFVSDRRVGIEIGRAADSGAWAWAWASIVGWRQSGEESWD